MAEALHGLQIWEEFPSLWVLPDMHFKDTNAEKQAGR